MINLWFFIANPEIADWEDCKDWIKNEGYYSWGIPNKSKDIENLLKVNENDIILCYRAIKKELIGCCTCKLPPYIGDVETENVNPDFINRIGISKIKFKTPIKLDELKQMELEVINEYLDFPRGRSVIPVPKSDWNKLKKKLVEFQEC